MPAFQQFDPDASTMITERDIRHRWGEFHHAVRQMSGTRLQRTLGRMLGENTFRYRLARLVGRPLLQIVRALKHRAPSTDKAPLIAPELPPKIFPINYRPRPYAPAHDLESLASALRNVAEVIVDETGSTSDAAIEALNNTLANTEATWLFIVDSSVSDVDRALTVASLVAQTQDDDDVLFADETGPNVFTPIFKSPGVGPHTLLSYNTIGRPALLRVTKVRSVGGFSREAGWAFEHDIYLKLNEARATFRHLPILLPAGRPTIAFRADHLQDDSCRVVHVALDRRCWKGSVSPGAHAGSVRWLLDPPAPEPTIDIIIPTRDRVDLVKRCIDAIEDLTTYANYDIIILDNDSVEQATLDYFATTKYRVVPCPGVFNYAHIVNRGVNHSSAEFIVTLNNDTILLTPNWLERMVSLASLDDVSIVGACLIDQDGRREHESIVIAPYPQHLRSDSNYPHDDQFIEATRDVAAVTGAIQMVRRSLWQELGGMDEQLKVTMNDVDICLRSQLDGRHVVYVPDVQLFHHVSSSRGKLDPMDDRNRFIRRWDIFGTFRDPYFPTSITLLGEKMYYLPPEALDVGTKSK